MKTNNKHQLTLKNTEFIKEQDKPNVEDANQDDTQADMPEDDTISKDILPDSDTTNNLEKTNKDTTQPIELKNDTESTEEELNKNIHLVTDELETTPTSENKPDTSTESFAHLMKELIALKNLFNTKLKYDKHREEIINKLHDENQKYKSDLLKKTQLPIFNDLIMFLDDFKKMMSNYQDKPQEEVDVARLLKDISDIPEDIEYILSRYGVVAHTAVPLDDFNPKLHKAVKRTKTPEQDKDGKIDKVIKTGYDADDNKIRFSEVHVYKYEAETQQDIPTPEIENVD